MSTYQIVIGFDFSEQSELALAQAVDAASSLDASKLHLVQVIEQHHSGEHPLQAYDHKTELAAAQSRMNEHVANAFANKPAGMAFVVHSRAGKPADELLRLAHDLRADMIFVGTHGRKGIQRWVLGSVAERVVRYAACPVLVARPKQYGAEPLPKSEE